MKKPHKPDAFERDILSFIERRRGQPIDDDFMSAFATFFWRKKLAFELQTMRDMVKR